MTRQINKAGLDLIRDFEGNFSSGADLGVIPHPAQKPVGNAGCSPGTAGNFHRPIGRHRHAEQLVDVAADDAGGDEGLGGFAAVAWPVKYGDTGVMTFMVSHDGVVYQKDLGPDTAARAAATAVAPMRDRSAGDTATLGAEDAYTQLRERQLDALVVDVRRVAAASDLNITHVVEMKAGFVCRQGHPIFKRHPGQVPFEALLDYPVASTPLSQEVARLLVDHFGPKANPEQLTTLQCEEIPSLIDVVQQTDAIYLGILGAARQGLASGSLVELAMDPPFRAGALLALITLAGRTELPIMSVFREFVTRQLTD